MIETGTLTLADFLLARIAEDHQLAPADDSLFVGDRWATFAWGAEIDLNGRRLLADCEAKRRIVELHETASFGRKRNYCVVCDAYEVSEGSSFGDFGPCDTLRLLALPYADHPDFRDEWRP